MITISLVVIFPFFKMIYIYVFLVMRTLKVDSQHFSTVQHSMINYIHFLMVSKLQ